MEKIKFRCFNKKTKKMWDSESLRNMGGFALLSGHSSQDFLVLPYPQDDYILMQYTGLKDKNGVDIYFDDLTKINNTIYRIVELRGAVAFVCQKTGDFWSYACNLDTSRYGELVGNIYKNTELLEE